MDTNANVTRTIPWTASSGDNPPLLVLWLRTLLKLNALIILFVLVVLVLARAQTAPVLNPFSDFVDFVSINADSAPALRNATCQSTDASIRVRTCLLDPGGGVFSITVIFQYR